MDAKIFGAFIAECRKEKNMTQADLAMKLNITDKAVSRWERGIGFPDINIIEPLASALEISVLDLMKSERILSNAVTKEETADIITDTLHAVKLQRRQERKNALSVSGATAVAVILALFFDSMQWKMDTLIFTGVGVVFPMFCALGFLTLLGNGVRRKIIGKPCGQTFAIALVLLLLLTILMGIPFLIGALGIGPVPN